jgi:hypothetical protein
MIDLSSKRMLSPKINALIDKALEVERDQQPKRDYLGGSRLGVECERALQFEFFKAPKDPGKNFDGRILRVFERGHWVESAVIRWLRLAGVTILTEDDNGQQFEFSLFDGLLKGHSDGVIVDGPEAFGPFPRLWENKGLQQSDYKAIVKHGLKHEKPVYYAQCQVYMDRFKLTENPALFSAVNMNRMEIHWESVPFNQGAMDALGHKAVRILQACLAGELLPRLSQDPNFYLCKFCDWPKRCFSLTM